MVLKDYTIMNVWFLKVMPLKELLLLNFVVNKDSVISKKFKSPPFMYQLVKAFFSFFMLKENFFIFSTTLVAFASLISGLIVFLGFLNDIISNYHLLLL